MKLNLFVLFILILFPNVLSFAEEKLQIMTTKKIENCSKRSKIGDTLYMEYTVRQTFTFFIEIFHNKSNPSFREF
jgi:hypothetical protein